MRATEAKAKRKEVSLSRFFSLNGFSLKIGSATCLKGIFVNFQEKRQIPCSSFPSIPVA